MPARLRLGAFHCRAVAAACITPRRAIGAIGAVHGRDAGGEDEGGYQVRALFPLCLDNRYGVSGCFHEKSARICNPLRNLSANPPNA
jgi:hypothetical protein